MGIGSASDAHSARVRRILLRRSPPLQYPASPPYRGPAQTGEPPQRVGLGHVLAGSAVIKPGPVRPQWDVLCSDVPVSRLCSIRAGRAAGGPSAHLSDVVLDRDGEVGGPPHPHLTSNPQWYRINIPVGYIYIYVLNTHIYTSLIRIETERTLDC